jgi:hypothetical protein
MEGIMYRSEDDKSNCQNKQRIRRTMISCFHYTQNARKSISFSCKQEDSNNILTILHKFVCRVFKWHKVLSVKYTNTRAVCKVRGLTLFRVGTLWRCGDGLFFEVPPLACDALLTTLHPLLENVLRTVRHKLQEDSGTGGFLHRSSVFMVGKAQKSHGTRSELYGGRSNGVPPISVSASIATLAACGLALSWRLLRHPKKGSFKTTVTHTLTMVRGMKIAPLLRYPHRYNLA